MVDSYLTVEYILAGIIRQIGGGELYGVKNSI